MKINREELIQNLNLIKDQIGGGKILKYNSNFIFNGEFLIVFNDRIFAAIKFPTEFIANVPGEEFFKIINSIRAKNINITKKEEDNLSITTKNINILIKCLSIDLSIIDQLFSSLQKNNWSVLPVNFTEGLLLNVFCTSRDFTKPLFTCVHVKGKIVEATDNYRISRFVMSTDVKEEFFLPNDNVLSFLKLKILFSHYQKINNWLFFSDEQKKVYFGMRDMVGEFPDTSSFFAMKGKKVILPGNIESNIDLVSVLAEGDYDFDKRITFEIKDGILKCRTSHEKGKIETKINIDTKQKILFEINPIFLKEIIKKTKTFVYNDSFLKFIDSNYQYIISLYSGE
jgi:hypothetical protein